MAAIKSAAGEAGAIRFVASAHASLEELHLLSSLAGVYALLVIGYQQIFGHIGA